MWRGVPIFRVMLSWFLDKLLPTNFPEFTSVPGLTGGKEGLSFTKFIAIILSLAISDCMVRLLAYKLGKRTKGLDTSSRIAWLKPSSIAYIVWILPVHEFAACHRALSNWHVIFVKAKMCYMTYSKDALIKLWIRKPRRIWYLGCSPLNPRRYQQ